MSHIQTGGASNTDAEATRDLQRVEFRLEGCRRQLELRLSELRQTHADVGALRAEVEQLRLENLAIVSARSYRVLEPARYAYRVVRRGAGHAVRRIAART